MLTNEYLKRVYEGLEKRLPGFEAFDVFKHVARVRLGGRLLFSVSGC